MKKLVILIWLLIPVLAGAYHLGPGQRQITLDDAGAAARHADRLVANEQWALAVAEYDRALELLPEDKVQQSQRLRLAKAKAQMFAAQLPAARQDLSDLVADLAEDENCDPQLLRDSRAALANSQYYITWLMRLEGQPRELWEPEIESSRQIYKLLAEEADPSEQRARYQEDLESSIRLARIDLKDLQGLPLPSQ